MVAAICGAVLMTGCARSEVSQVELEARAEEVTALLLSAAEGVPRYQDDIIEADDRKMDTTFDNPWRYWEVHANIVLSEDTTTSPPQVRDEMMRLLRADGWSEDDRNDAISGGAETFRKQDVGGVWTVLLGAWESPPPKPQLVYFWVVSPSVDH